jgi:hypothetical protein
MGEEARQRGDEPDSFDVATAMKRMPPSKCTKMVSEVFPSTSRASVFPNEENQSVRRAGDVIATKESN